MNRRRPRQVLECASSVALWLRRPEDWRTRRRYTAVHGFMVPDLPGTQPHGMVHGFFRNPLSASHSSKRSIHLPTGFVSFDRRPKPWPLPA